MLSLKVGDYMETDNESMTLDEVAQFLKIHKNTLRRWIREGRIQGHKIGRKWTFLKSEIIGLIKES